MAGIMVSASTGAMNSLLGKLAIIMGEEFAKLKNLRKEVEFINDELASMKDVLERLADVDELDPQTRRWRDVVRDMSYDIENIIDDFMQNIGKKNENDGFARKTIRRLKTSRARHRIAGQIEEIKKLVCETSERRGRYKLDIPPSSDVAIDQRVVALYANAADLVGLEGPKNDIVNCLTDEEKQLKVVSIVGFGGLGKTTLAKEVYRALKGEFECPAFVPVSQRPNIPQLLHSLISQLEIKTSSHASELHDLIDKLRKHLQDKRYFIIIDDLWDVSTWDVINCAFPENDLGSRVIATTRIVDVAKACSSHGHDYILNMKPLSDKDSRRLFFGRIFGSEEACPNQLRDVSVQVLKKCGGLPLAIISISSLLASEGSNQKERWEHVRNSLGSGTNLTLEGMRQILNLSYKNLPPHLKTCLLYLGMYPEDYTIWRSDLGRQWIAEGFINRTHGQDVEKVATSYFNELVNRSLVQPVDFDSDGLVISCMVHDMMLDLILCKSAEENFVTVVEDPNAITGMRHKARRLSFRLDGATNGTILPGNISMSQVWSLMIFGSSQNIPPLSEFKFLRVLFVDAGGTIDLTGLCKLYQLRYLRISINSSCQLPTKIRGLPHLETLDVYSRSGIPSDVAYMKHIYNKLPDGIGNLKSLRYLYGFNLPCNSLDNIKGLGELTNLRYLTVTGGRYTADSGRRMDILCSSLEKICSCIEHLVLDLWGCFDVFEALSPPPRRLENFHMSQDSSFCRVPANWMGELHNLRDLKLAVDELLKDGVGILAELPALIDLDLVITRSPKEMIVIYGRAFPIMKRFKLHFSSASYLTFQAGAMPKLQRLRLEFNARRSEQNGAGPAGIEHLLALEELSAEIGGLDAMESDKRITESVFKSVISMHPSHPRVEINWKENERWQFEGDDDQYSLDSAASSRKLSGPRGVLMRFTF